MRHVEGDGFAKVRKSCGASGSPKTNKRKPLLDGLILPILGVSREHLKRT